VSINTNHIIFKRGYSRRSTFMRAAELEELISCVNASAYQWNSAIKG
jgi:hypothetical protein